MEVLSHTLLRILANPADISNEDQERLEQAITEYPYFQLARTLVAKAKHDQQAPDAYESLGYAAIYAPDRRHLRKVFYEDVRINWQPPADQLPNDNPVVSDNEAELETKTEVEPTIEATETREDVSFQPEESHDEPQAAVPETNDSDISSQSDTESTEAEPSGVANHDEEEEIVYRELEENLRKLREAKEESKEEEDDKKKITDSTEAPSETNHADISVQSPVLLDYIHGIEPISSERLGIHQQRQNELINKFVNSDTDAIGRFRPALPKDDIKSQDLSEGSSTYSTELVTENLAEIMLRQGKKDKAISIYQQLMLKFPEKKAYFAEKIDSLN